MAEQIPTQDLEMAQFTAELIEQKFADGAALDRDYSMVARLTNPVLREAATGAYREQMSILSAGIGELALDLPPAGQISDEIAALTGASRAARAIAKSVLRYHNALVEILPFGAAEIDKQAVEVVNVLESIRPELTPETQARLEVLQQVDGVLSQPITSPNLVDSLLNYFDHQEADTDSEQLPLLEQTYGCLSEQQLVRQLTKADPRSRLYEYCEAFRDHPAEMTTLTKAVYLFDSREVRKKQNTMYSTLNPKQKAGSVTHRDLAERGLVLQQGWINDNPDTSSTARRVVRSLSLSGYSAAQYVGTAIVGGSHYIWEEVSQDLTKQATE